MPVTLLMHKIIIIESLPEGHRKTGYDLEDYLDTQLRNEIEHQLEIVFKRVEDKKSLFKLLDDITEQLKKDGKIPVLQLDTHGGVDGIELSNGEQIRWKELRPIFTEINRVSRCNLLLVFSMCDGAHFLSELAKIAGQRCPCAAMLGAIDRVYYPQLLLALQVFYKTLLQTGEFEASVMTMNLETDSSLYIPLNAYDIYLKLQSGFIHQTVAPQLLDALVKQGLFSRESIKREFESPGSGFWSSTRDRFLMLDLFPENKARFFN